MKKKVERSYSRGVEPAQLRRHREAIGKPYTKERILQFIRAFRTQNGVSPTYKEIAVGIGWNASSRGTTKTICEELIVEGWLTKLPYGTWRSLLPVDPPPAEHYIPVSLVPKA